MPSDTFCKFWTRHSLKFLAVIFFLLPGLARAQSNEFRAYWVDAFHAGFRTSAEVNTLLTSARGGNFNAVVVEVRKRGDAYYNSNFEPKATDVSPQSYDPLADLIAKAHDTSGGKQRIEVHAWLVTYHIWNPSTAGGVPPQTNHPYNLHPDWLMKDVNSNTYLGGQYTFDQGHPAVQQHTFNVALDIVTNYDVDGINFDYIRYSSPDEGYNDVTVGRYNQLFGKIGKPMPSDSGWKQFRRDQISGLLRKVYLHTMAIKPQVKISADTICFAPGVTTLSQWYSSSAAWNSVLQDWRGWMEEGILDMTIPMAYFRQHTVNSNDWAKWNQFTKDFKYNRHGVLGPGIYLNSISNSIIQMRSTRDLTASGNKAEGVSLYSYAVVSKDGESRATFHTALTNSASTIYDPIAPGIFSQKVNPPLMPWKVTPTKGHLKGFIYGNNVTNPIDGAVATISALPGFNRTNDPTGFYGFVDLVPGNYTVSASYPGYATLMTNVTITAGSVSHRDFILSSQGPPAIVAQPESKSVYVGAVASFTVSAAGSGPLNYQWRKEGTNLAGASSATYTINNAVTNNAGNYTVIISNTFGSVTSQVATLTVLVPTVNTRLLPLWNLPPGSRTYLTTGGTERGLAYNPASGRLLLVSRSGSTQQIHALNSTNGDNLHTLNLGSGEIAGGFYSLNMIGAADDGAVYAANLTLDGATANFRIYRWANDNSGTVPTIAYSGNPSPALSQRWGDTLDVRGSGTNTQIIAGSRSSTSVTIFTTTSGATFLATLVDVPGVPGTPFGLGIAFGETNTFWGKANGVNPLRQVTFDLNSGMGSVLRTHGSPTIPNSIGPIGISTSLNLFAGIAVETPDHLRLYDLTSDSSSPRLIETNSFATDNDNANAVGSVDFGGDRVFALDCNNGIIAARILPAPVSPEINLQPQSLTISEGDNAVFTVTASGSEPLHYQWRFNGTPIFGTTTNSYTKFNALTADAGGYSVVITNIAGAITSSVAALIVQVPPNITTQPQSQTVNQGANATFTVVATGTGPLVYQWRHSDTNIPGATTSSYTVTNAQLSHAGTYSALVTNAAGAIASSDATLTVTLVPTNVQPAITTQPQSQSVKQGSNVTFVVQATGTPSPNYQWRFNTTNISGATSSNYLRTNLQLADAGNYSVVVSNIAGSVVSSNATLTVFPLAPLRFESLMMLSNKQVRLQMSGEPGSYVLESTADLTNWAQLINLTNTNGLFEFTDPATNLPKRLYRLKFP